MTNMSTPYKNLLQNQKAYEIGSWYVAFGIGSRDSLSTSASLRNAAQSQNTSIAHLSSCL